MITNEKPRTQSAGNPNSIDGESTYANFRASHRLSQKSEYVFGKSCPLMTSRDIFNRVYLHDQRWNMSKEIADQHLRREGYMPVWSREDELRAHLFDYKVSLINRHKGDIA